MLYGVVIHPFGVAVVVGGAVSGVEPGVVLYALVGVISSTWLLYLG